MTNDPYQALSRLSKVQYKKLLVLASLEFGWLGLDPEALVHEACLRLLDGRRKWPADVPLVACLWQIVRSLASNEIEHRKRFRTMTIESLELQTAGPDVDGMADDECPTDADLERTRVRGCADALVVEFDHDLARFRASLADDPRLQVLLDGKQAGRTQCEIAKHLKLSNASVSGLMRTLAARAKKFFDIEL